MNYLEQLTNILTELDQVELNVRADDRSTAFGALMASYAWRGATKLANALIRAEEMNNAISPSKPGFINNSIKQGIVFQEQRADEAQSLLEWALPQASPGIAPDVDAVMTLISTPRTPTAGEQEEREEEIREAMEALQLTRQEVIHEMESAGDQTRLVVKHWDLIKQRLTAAIGAASSTTPLEGEQLMNLAQRASFELTQSEALILANRAADKCSQYAESAQRQFFRTPKRATFRRNRVDPRVKLAANKMLLIDIINRIEDFIDVIEAVQESAPSTDAVNDLDDMYTMY